MGCDIHIVIQRQEADGSWIELPWQREPYTFKGARPAVNGFPVAPACFSDRNYDLFAILADVRNGSGFAGIKTGEGWPSIAPDRGLPDGFDSNAVLPCPMYREYGPRYIGDHSFTWVSLDELKAFAWDTVSTRLYGVVSADDYERLSASNQAPTSYCGDTSGPGIKVYSPEAYAKAKANGTLVKRPHVRMHWMETAREATNDYPSVVIPWLDSLADGKPLRLVIGFDS